MKRALIIFAIITIISAHFMPYINIKADTVDLSTLQDKIADVDTMVSSEQKLFKQSLGLATALSMRQTGYSAPETNAIEELGDWVWSKIHDIGDGTRDVAQWVVNSLSNIIDGMKPDHSSGSHRFAYNPTDAPLYNALYTDDEWNSLVSSWASANSHDDNFISFADITDDVEGWADKYYDALYPLGMNGNPAYDVNAMSVQLRNSIISTTPTVIGFMGGAIDGVTRYYIDRAFYKHNATLDKLVYEYSNGYWNSYFYWSDGTKTVYYTDKYASSPVTLYTVQSIAASGTVPAHYKAFWQENLNNSGGASMSLNASPGYISGAWNETTATSKVYEWYHRNLSGSQKQYMVRACNIYCYWKNPDTGELNPFSVHPGTHTEWDAPTQTPIIINNTRSYISVSNNTTITDYTNVYNYVTNNNITNDNVVNNVFNQTVINYILPNPTYIEGPEPTPEPNEPTPTDEPTPTGEPIDPSLTPTPINVQPIIPWPTGLPITPPPESAVPVPGSEVNPTPSDIPSINIDIPSLASLTTDGQIQNSVLVNDEGNDVDNDDIVQDLFNVIPGENDPINLQLIIFGLLFVGIVVTYLTK